MQRYGETVARSVAVRIGQSAASEAALANIVSADCADGMVVVLEDTGSKWQYVAASTSASTANLVVVPGDSPSAGRWLRIDRRFGIKLAIAFGTADAAALLTLPAGWPSKLLVDRAFWEVTSSFTGGSSSAIGISSTNASYNTKGDILGGASGDVAATLVSTGVLYKGGTLGAKFGSNGVIALVAGDAVRFDRITSAFTAGAGFAHLLVHQVF